MKSIFTAAAVAALSSLAAAQNWTQLSPGASPPASVFPGLAYDWSTSTSLLFGGYDGATALSDTWEWNGTTWTQLTPATVPTGRDSMGFAYDVARNRTVMFGGWDTNGTPLADTWEWNGTDWVDVTPAGASPGPRVNPGMVYDLTRGVCVLFGGYDWNTGVGFDDTWEWNGTTWTQIATATMPVARDSHAMAFDITRNRTVLFGGWDANGVPQNDTWEYDGTNWTQMNPAVSPLARYYTVMAFDLATGRCVLHSGYDGTITFGDTWEWDGTNWTQTTGTQPNPGRDSVAMAYDTSAQQVLMFGGWDVNGTPLGDTFTYSAGASASYSTFGSGCMGSAGIPALAPQGVPSLGASFSVDCVNLPAAGGLAYMVLGFSNTTWNGIPLPASLAPFGFGSCQGFVSADDGALIVNNAGVATWTVTIPNQPSLAGFNFYNQCVSFDAGAGNPAGAAVSDAGQGVIN